MQKANTEIHSVSQPVVCVSVHNNPNHSDQTMSKVSGKRAKANPEDHPKKRTELQELETEQELEVKTQSLSLAHPNAVVTVNFNQPRPFVSLLNVLSSVLSDGVFQIINKDQEDFKDTSSKLSIDKNRSDFSGLYAEFIDKSNTCIVIFKLAGEVVCNPAMSVSKDDMQFCVHIPTMYSHLKSINPSFCLQLYRRKDDPELHFKAFAKSLGFRQFRHIRMATWDRLPDKFEISDIDYNYNVVFELGELRSVIQRAKSVGCEQIRIRIMEPRATLDGVHRCFFIIHVYGANSYDEEVWVSATEVVEEPLDPPTNVDAKPKENNTLTRLVIKNSDMVEMQQADDPKNYHRDDVIERYSGLFAVEYINVFIKSLDRHTVNLHITQDKPMIVTCSLGDETSFLAFVLAQQKNDDGEKRRDVIEAFASD